MDNSSFVVRHTNTGLPAEDLGVGIAEARAAMSVDAAGLSASAISSYAAGLTTLTSTQLADKTNAVNTAGKVKGKPIYCSTNDLMYYAIATTDTGKWRLFGAVDTTGDVTPS